MYYKIIFFISLFILLGITIYIVNKYLSKDNIVRNRNNNDVRLTKQQLYEKLMKDFNKIFPDRNRNSGGVQFFSYIYNTIKPTKEEFDIYIKLPRIEHSYYGSIENYFNIIRPIYRVIKSVLKR